MEEPCQECRLSGISEAAQFPYENRAPVNASSRQQLWRLQPPAKMTSFKMHGGSGVERETVFQQRRPPASKSEATAGKGKILSQKSLNRTIGVHLLLPKKDLKKPRWNLLPLSRKTLCNLPPGKSTCLVPSAPPPHLLCSSLPSSLGVNVSRVPGDRSGRAGDAEGQGCPLWPDF